VFQHTHSTLTNLLIDTLQRKYRFTPNPTKISIRTAVYPYGSDAEINYSIAINDNINPFIRGICYRPTNITFNVFDSLTIQPLFNATTGKPGQFGSLAYPENCINGREYDFAFATGNATDRKKAADFMDNTIPTGAYVVVRSISIEDLGYYFAKDWQKDESVFGPNNSLYSKLKQAGFELIDSFNRPRSFIFVYRKGVSSFQPIWAFSENQYDKAVLNTTFIPRHTTGSILSPLFGIANKWNELKFDGKPTNTTNFIKLQVLGLKTDTTSIADTLLTIKDPINSTDIGNIDAKTLYFNMYAAAK
jgi:hypothetical protein